MVTATEPRRSPGPGPPRRALLARAVVAAPAAALPAVALAAPAAADGRLLALGDLYRAHEAEGVALYGLAEETGDPATDAMVVPAFDRADETVREIAACPAAG